MAAIGTLSIFVMLAATLLLDGVVRPRRHWGRVWQGSVLHGLVTTALFGLLLAGTGSPPIAALLTTALVALLMIASNAKYVMLGEPLLFSDLALIGWVFRHPRFYLTALSGRQRWVLAFGAPVFLLTLIGTFVAHWATHLVGVGLLVASLAGLALLTGLGPFAALVQKPDIESDVRRLGLLTTLLLYWHRWRAIRDPEPCAAIGDGSPDAPQLIVIVQCESFSDPVALSGDPALELSGLSLARAGAWQWGDLAVSGFGAYTMRSEYGVLFGRSEAALGFRRYDPFLTARGETSYALPKRIAGLGYRSLFVHPHDVRFYGRDHLMPASGFEALIGDDDFPPVPPGSRYVSDETLGTKLCDLIDRASGRTLLYAVTMENHGPWIRDPKTGSHGGINAYLHHLRNSDAMLSRLIEHISGAGRSALLVFFGDHRPSIPGVTESSGDRHTPYVMVRFSADGCGIEGTGGPVDLTPDGLHIAILNCVAFKTA
jgi:hypothetical protein